MTPIRVFVRCVPDAAFRKRVKARLPGRVTHTFTHYSARSHCLHSDRQAHGEAARRRALDSVRKLAGEALPSVMRKVIAHALEYEDANPN